MRVCVCMCVVRGACGARTMEPVHAAGRGGDKSIAKCVRRRAGGGTRIAKCMAVRSPPLPRLLGQRTTRTADRARTEAGSRDRTARVRDNAVCARRGSKSGRVLRTRLTSAALRAAGVAADADGDGEEGTGEGAGDAPEAAEPGDVPPSPPSPLSPPPEMDPGFPGEHAFPVEARLPFRGQSSAASACSPGRAPSKTWVTTAAPIPKARTTATTTSRVLRREHRELCAVAGAMPTSISSSRTVMVVVRREGQVKIGDLRRRLPVSVSSQVSSRFGAAAATRG